MGIPISDITRSDLEAFMLSRNWSQVVNVNGIPLEFPVEISAAFDANGRLLQVWVGNTVWVEGRGALPFGYGGSLPIGTSVYTHLHPHGALDQFSRPDIRYFVNNRLQVMSAVTPRYTFEFAWTSETWSRIQALSESQIQDLRTIANDRIVDIQRDFGAESYRMRIPEVESIYDAGEYFGQFNYSENIVFSGEDFLAEFTITIAPNFNTP
jgi:hypothetical protein